MFTATCVSDSDSAEETFKFHFKSFQSQIKNTAKLKLLVIWSQHTKIYGVLKIDCNVSRGWIFLVFQLLLACFWWIFNGIQANIRSTIGNFSNTFDMSPWKWTIFHTYCCDSLWFIVQLTSWPLFNVMPKKKRKKSRKPQLRTAATQSTTLYNRIIHRWIQSDFNHTTVTLVALSYQRDFISPIVWIVVSWLFIPFFCFCFI